MTSVLVIYVLMAIGNSVSAYNPACLPIKHEEQVSSGGYIYVSYCNNGIKIRYDQFMCSNCVVHI